jgi:pimeloyl-ACP methyl ester carboxylesterase
MPYIELPPMRLWYAETGRRAHPGRPPLVLVHGAGGSHLDWPGTLRRVEGWRVLALDLPRHGRSAPPGRESIEGYATVVRALLDALEIEQAVLCGHSMGGAVCQTVALDHPARVAGLVLIATGAKLRVAPGLLEAFANNPAAALDAMAGRLGLDRLRGVSPDVMHGDLLACDAFDVMDRLGAISAPALVISGTDDPMTPLKYGRYLAGHISNAELVTVEGGGHMLALERPALVGDAVARFLSSLVS